MHRRSSSRARTWSSGVAVLLAVLLGLAPAAPAALATGCGGIPDPPKRRVFESSVSAWSFRRYQRVVDVEVYVPDNAAVAHTASYVHQDAEKIGRVEEGDVVNAFVTEYETPAGVLRHLVKFARRLAQESGYVVEEKKIGGERVILVAGQGETWALWCYQRFVVKIGGHGLDSVPSAVVKAYGEPYPSQIPSGVLEGPLPEGPDEAPPPEEDYDPDNPRPDFDHDQRKSAPDESSEDD